MSLCKHGAVMGVFSLPSSPAADLHLFSSSPPTITPLAVDIAQYPPPPLPLPFVFAKRECPSIATKRRNRYFFSLLSYLILSRRSYRFEFFAFSFTFNFFSFNPHCSIYIYIYVCMCMYIFWTRSGRDHTFPFRSQLDPTQRDWIHGDWRSRYTVGRFAFFVTTVTILADNNNNKGGSCF